ncbi:MAG TPA: ARMT1-like domain-containing protein [Perlabentimonas sp.]|nr:ARMT1-like domain-containing protein [Perlabentimonas sp.]
MGSIDKRCVACIKRTYNRLFEKYNVTESQQRIFLAFLEHVISGEYTESTPDIQRNLSKMLCRIINIDDPFKEEKDESNKIALQLYDEWKPKVLNADDPFKLALRLALAGNIMDYGASTSFDIHKTIDKVLNSSFGIDKTDLLKQKLGSAKSVLYLGDNAGEIVFDRLFIEVMMHGNVTYVVKGAPALNDATAEDAVQVGMYYAADVISNGYDAPSTVLERCSDEFLSAYSSADLIISKGQGNLEGLINEKDPRIFFLLMVKCDLIAEILGVVKGDFVVCNFNPHDSSNL